ncbi:MAG: LmeA family phospholipid-binding protein [Almyronema sp.]
MPHPRDEVRAICVMLDRAIAWRSAKGYGADLQTNREKLMASIPDYPAENLETQDEIEPETEGSRLISRVLSPALRLWLQTQVAQSENLRFQIIGRDRQLLQGCVPQVNLSAQTAVYRGLQLGQVQLTATDIRINLGQVVRGKALRLLEPFPICGSITLSAADLQACLQTATMAEALQNFLIKICRDDRASGLFAKRVAAIAQVPTQQLVGSGQLQGDVLTISLRERTAQQPLILCTRLQVQQGRLLTLLQPQLLDDAEAIAGTPLPELHEFQVNLGADVEIQHFELKNNQLNCHGRVNVRPAP